MKTPFLFFIFLPFISLACASSPGPMEHSDAIMESPLRPVDKKDIEFESEKNAVDSGTTDSFRLGSEDIIMVTVLDERDLSTELVVGPDGNISLPLIGTIQAKGKTREELRSDIENKLKKFIKKPQVGVMVNQFNSKGYYVLGKVNNPGYYKLKSEVDLLRALSEAGGLATDSSDSKNPIDIADLDGAYLARNNQVLPVNFRNLLIDGDLSHNVKIKNGDLIYVPSSFQNKVLVVGELFKPNLIRFGSEISLTEAIGEAKGFIPETAMLQHVKLIRGPLRDPEIYNVNVKHILAGKARDIKLQRQDIVYIPATSLTTWSRIMRQILPFLKVAEEREFYW